MDQIGEIILRLKITELEAQLVLREIERVGLSRRIDDPGFDPDEKDRAIFRRERTIVEWGEIMTELHELRARQDGAVNVTQRADPN